ncbi:MAG: thiamine phosphate synthase, partial [Rickettsiales bacterium]
EKNFSNLTSRLSRSFLKFFISSLALSLAVFLTYEIGESKHSIELAFKAQKLGVNYVSFGAFFPTNTKKNTKSAKLRLLQDWQKQSSLPCAAIGGINQNNIQQIAKHKPYYICLISAIWSATNPILAVQKITQLLKNLA